MVVKGLRRIALGVFLTLTLVGTNSLHTNAQTETGSIGIEGRVGAPPPTTGATISLPLNNTRFTSLPIAVSGICPNGLLVKVFRNEVFSGSVTCDGGSFSIQIDLFSAQNELVARVYDNLDQPGPDSNIVTVFFDDNSANAGNFNRISLSSNFAKRGANPGTELTWPIVVSGGVAPYAISIDWGDSQTSLVSVAASGEFSIKHIYESSGIYKVIVRAVDSNEATAYLQLVAVANGDAGQQISQDDEVVETKTKIVWEPLPILFLLIIIAFWLGRRYELARIRKSIEAGQRPF